MTRNLADLSNARWRSRALRFFLWVVLGGLYTWFILDYSCRMGRLSVPPDYDDVVYMTDGMRRLRLLRQDGLFALLADYVENSTHSPYSSGMAFLGFSFLGPHNWAPYVTNAILMIGMLAGIDALCAGRPLWEKVGLGIFSLSVPMSGFAVQEFRPDAPGAWCGAACAAVILNGPWLTASRLRLVAAGVMGGLSLIVKPTFAPLMLGLFGLEMLLVTVRDRFDAPSEWTLRKALRPCMIASGVALLVALPYYSVNLEHLINYYKHVYGNYIPLRKEQPLGIAEALLFYVDGLGSAHSLRRHVYVWLFLLVAGGIYAATIRKRVAWRQVAVWVLTVGAAYAVVVFNNLRSQFLGLPFQTMLLAAVLTYLAWVFRELQVRGVHKAARVAVMLILLVAGITSFKKPLNWTLVGQEKGPRWNAAAAQLHEILHSRDEGARILNVFFTATGNINQHLMTYLNYQQGKTVHFYFDCSLSNDPALYKTNMDQADWVVASEAENTAMSPLFPSSLYAAESLRMVRERADYECAGEVLSFEGKKFFVFYRKPGSKPADTVR